MIVPFYKQEFWFSCFVACVRMILEYYGIKKSERELRPLLRVTPHATGLWFFVELGLESMGLHFHRGFGFSLDELRELVKNNTPLIVSLKFSEKHPNHTVVVTDITDKSIIVHDPDLGPNIRINVKQFLEAWSKRKHIAGFIKRG